MTRDLGRAAGVGLLVGLAFGLMVAQVYVENPKPFETEPAAAAIALLIFPAGWGLARFARLPHPVRTAALAPLLLWVLRGVMDLAVPSPGQWRAFAGFAVLAVVCYAGAAWLTGRAGPAVRGVVVGMVCVGLIVPAEIQERRDAIRDRQIRLEWIDTLRRSVPLAVPDTVPGRTLAEVSAIGNVLSLDYARALGSEPDVFVQVSEGGDPRAACAQWTRADAGVSCERLAAGRWLCRFYGRLVMFARVGTRTVEVDSSALSLDETVTVASGLRAVSAEYLADAGS